MSKLCEMCDRENDPNASCKEVSVINRKEVTTIQERRIQEGRCEKATVEGVSVVMQPKLYTEVIRGITKRK